MTILFITTLAGEEFSQSEQRQRSLEAPDEKGDFLWKVKVGKEMEWGEYVLSGEEEAG